MNAIAALDILIVDDHEGMRTLLTTILARFGAARIRQAASGAAALAMLEAEPAALILTDHMMPEMDGIALTERVRARDSKARIIMITGRAEPRYAEAAAAAGANAVLVKPVSPRSLIEAIERVFS